MVISSKRGKYAEMRQAEGLPGRTALAQYDGSQGSFPGWLHYFLVHLMQESNLTSKLSFRQRLKFTFYLLQYILLRDLLGCSFVS